MKKIFLIIALVSVTLLASATTYQISPAGNDTTGNGSIGTPWRMLSKACAMVTTAGDVIHVNSGTYQDNNRCDLALGVSIEGAGKTTTFIKTNYVYPSSPNTAGYGYISVYSTVINTNGNQHISGISFNGLKTSNRGITVYKRGNVAVYGCDFKDFRLSATIFYNDANNNMNEVAAYASGNSFHDNTVKDCTLNGVSYAGNISLLAQENATIYNNVITDERRTDTGYACISGLSCRKIKIYNNTLKRPVKYGTTWVFTIEFRFSFGEMEVYGNAFSGTMDICNNMKKNTAYGLWVHDNIVGSDVEGEHEFGIELEGTNIGVRIERNHIRNTRYGITISTNMPDGACLVDSVAFVGNVLMNIGYPATRFTGTGIRISGSTTYVYVPQYRNIMFYNNTIKGNSFAYSGICLNTKGYYDDIKIKNNIITNFDLSTSYGAIYVNKDVTQTMVVDSLVLSNNIIYQTGNSNNIKYNNITATNVTEVSTLKVNPLLVSSTDYSLQSASPARNAGLNLGLTKDIVNRAIPQESVPDIGAFEYYFENPWVLPTVTLDDPYALTSRSISIYATAVLDGGGTVSERGIVWNTSSNPTTANNKIIYGAGLGRYFTLVDGLLPETKYYLRAYSINEVGTSYSNQVIVTTTSNSTLLNTDKSVMDKGNTIIY